MKKTLIIISSFFSAILFPLTLMGQEVAEAASDAGLDDSLGSLWDLIEKAGPLRWPIFATLLAGLFLVAYQAFGMWTDKQRSKKLQAARVETMGINQIVDATKKESNHMLARLVATMLNVYQTRGSAESLHDEVSNFVDSEQDRFATFRGRIDFLSDAAGALGLLGTVWGMWSVFSGNTADKQIILQGMGVALITTLMGLVVSLILNFLVTETFSYFNKQVRKVSHKADQIRFRLLEIASQERAANGFVAPPAVQQQQNQNNGAKKRVQQTANVTNGHRRKQAAPVDDVTQVSAPTKSRFPDVIEWVTPLEASAGQIIRKNQLQVKDNFGRPFENCDVRIQVTAGGGLLGKNKAHVTTRTDANGIVIFDWQLGKKVGKQALQASTVNDDHPITGTTVVVAKAGPPAKVSQEGNVQSGTIGSLLPQSLTVKIEDAAGNPVAGHKVKFKVAMGGGSLQNGKSEQVVQSDKNGCANMSYQLGHDAGFNVIKANVDGFSKPAEFQAMGQ